MKTTILTLAIAAALTVFEGTLSAESIFVANFDTDRVGEYNAVTGASINSAFVSGLNGPFGLALSGNRLFVGNYSGNSIGEYDAWTGAAINDSFISGLNAPCGIGLPWKS